MTPDRRKVVDRVAVWQDVLLEHARPNKLDPWLSAGVVCQESAGNPWAIRVERGFFRRYNAGLIALITRTPSRYDNQWFAYPDLFSASYGLFQLMYPVALELGAVLQYPTELLDPAVNARLGSFKLAKHIAEARASQVVVPFRGPSDAPIRRALLRWNGGGDPEYPNKILSWRQDCIDAGVFNWTKP